MTSRLSRSLLSLAVFPVAVLALTGACGGAPALATHLSSGCHDGRRMALTFDDGPNPSYTGQILDVLANAHAPATFFVEGQAVEAHPEIVQREVALGMAIGSHSYAHGDDLPAMSAHDFTGDLHRADALVRAAAGFAPALYRAPYGHTGDTMLRVLGTEGYMSIGWDIDSTD
jgi:peptidoglycan/xylan/chitin deacetylase (PgdA/CDA1 family)